MLLANSIATLSSGTTAASQDFSAASFVSGRRIIVVARVQGSADPVSLSISDDQGHTWNQIGSFEDHGLQVWGAWYTDATVTASVTITITPDVDGDDWSGICAEIDPDGDTLASITNVGESEETTLVSSDDVTLASAPAADSQVVVFTSLDRGNRDMSPDTGFTEVDEVASSSSVNDCHIQAQNGSSPPQTVTTAADGTARFGMIGFEVAVSGGGGGEGFAKIQGAPRASVQGEHAGDGNVTLKDAPTMLAWTEKSGAGFALAFDADLGINRTQAVETGEGFGRMRSYPTLIALGAKGGESEITGFGGPILLGQGEKSGEGFGLDRDASFLLALAQKGGTGEGLKRGHPYLLSHGQKSVAGAGEGFGLVFGHGRLLAESTKAGTGHGLTIAEARALAHAAKATSGHGLARALPSGLARSLKSGQGLALAADEAFLAALGAKAVGSHVLLLDSPYLLADGTFANVVLLPPQIVDFPARVWVVDAE